MIACYAFAASTLAFLSGCSLFGPSRAELQDGARSLVPSRSAVVEEVEGDCVELARSPSCVHIYFILGETLDARTKIVEDAARESGWSRTRHEAFPGGNQLRYRRGRLKAVVSLLSDERSASCRDDPRRDCADVVMVEKAP